MQKLRERIAKSAEHNGVEVDECLSEDLMKIMEESNDYLEKHFPEGTFRRLFWDQQLQAAKAQNAWQMRWHPCMIRWCLNLKLLSSSAYHALRTSGFIQLPSERTLRDYTHFIKSKAGFNSDLDKFLADEAQLKTLPDWKEWNKSVDSRKGFSEGEKTLMCLSRETLEGLHVTGLYTYKDIILKCSSITVVVHLTCAVKLFVDVTRYLLKLPGVTGQYLLSERFSQDTRELLRSTKSKRRKM